MRPIHLLALTAALILTLAGCSKSDRLERAINKAQTLRDSGNYAAAEIEYRNALKIEPANKAAVRELAFLFSDQGRTGPAVALLLQAKDNEPNNTAIRIQLARLYLSVGASNEACAEAEHVLTLQPKDPEAIVILAQACPTSQIPSTRDRINAALSATGETAPLLLASSSLDIREHALDQAEKKLLRARDLDPKAPDVWSALAALYFAQRPDDARQALKTAADLSPLRSARRITYARFEVQTNHREAGRLILEDLNKRAPDYIPAWVWRAELSLAEQKLDDAKAAIEKALAIDNTSLEALLVQARINVASNAPLVAIKSLERTASLYPKFPPLYYQLAQAQLAINDPIKAATSLKQALALAPLYSEASLLLASTKIRQGDLPEAERLVKDVLKRQPRNPQAQILLADILRLRGNSAAALQIYSELLKAYPEMTQLELVIGMTQRSQGHLPEAHAAFERALEKNPNDFVIVEQLINLALSEQKFAEANTYATQAASRAPNNPAPQLLLARVALAQNDKATAEQYLRKAIALNPDFRTAYLLLSQIYLSDNKTDKAIAELKTAVEKQPSDIASLALLGALYERQNHNDEARATYEKILAFKPTFTLALNNLAYLLIEHFNTPEKALELAKKARELAPSDPTIADTLGWAAFNNAQYPWALTLLQEASEKTPEAPDIRYHLGLAQYMLGNETGAQTNFEKAIALAPNSSFAADMQSRLQILALDPQNTPASARDTLTAQITKSPKDPVALARLANLYRQTGENGKALSLLAQAAAASPSNLNVLLALARAQAEESDGPTVALETARAAYKINPSSPEVLQLLGHLALRKGDAPWAISILRQIEGPAAANPDTQFDLAQAALTTGQIPESLAAINTALAATVPFAQRAEAETFATLLTAAQTPATASASLPKAAAVNNQSPCYIASLYLRASAAETSDNPRSAITAHEKLLEAAPNFTPSKRQIVLLSAHATDIDERLLKTAIAARTAYPQDTLLARAYGSILTTKGDFNRAIPLLKESLAANPDEPTTLYFLGLAQSKLKIADGRNNLRRSLDLGLKAPFAEQAKKALEETK